MSVALAEPRSCVIVNGRRRIASKFVDGSEMIEEYDVITDDLLLRKCRSKTTLGGFNPWEVEVGSESPTRNLDKELVVEASGSPQVVKQDAVEFYVFRIRNLPYPKEVFSVTVEHSQLGDLGEIVVRTSNKKYFKRLSIPDMKRRQLRLDPSQLSFDVQHSTLIIRYKKPLVVLAAESSAKKERASLPARRIDDADSRVGCNQQ